MKYFIGLIAGLTFACTNGQAQSESGWIPLFDGRSLSGWHLFKKPGTAPAWTVRDGSIYLDITQKEGRGDLVTDKIFGDFHLSFEWRVGAGSNSGLIFFVQETEGFQATWHTGPEFQVIDNSGYGEPLGKKQMAASLYDLIPCPADYVKPTGEWNRSEVISRAGQLSFVQNGQPVFSLSMDSEEWRALLGKSKFNSMKDFAKRREGRIALQDHGGAVWYRNIRIKSL